MSSTVMQRCRVAAGLVWFGVAVACDAPAGPQSNRFVEALSPTSLQGTVGTAVASAPTVIVKDRAGNPLPNVPVRFAASSASGPRGLVSVAETLTNAQGVASSVEWTLSTRAGQNSLSASAEGASPIWFSAEGLADAPARLEWLDRYYEIGYPGMTVHPRLRVHDRFGNNVPNVTVNVAITGGSGSLGGTSATTNRESVASVPPWILGPGMNTITASVLDLLPVSWTIEAPAIAMGYALETIDGKSIAGTFVVREFIAFSHDGRFVTDMISNHQFELFHSIANGRYQISGSTVVLTYDPGNQYQETGSINGDWLVLERPNDYACCSRWAYKKVVAAGP